MSGQQAPPSEEFTFAVPFQPQQTQQQKTPLTARSTVTHTAAAAPPRTSTTRVTSGQGTLEHRNKGESRDSRDPLLTRLIYRVLAWFDNVPLEKGYSQVDWMRISRARPAPKLRRGITMAEVRQHKSVNDAWMVFRNKVYDITPYLKFHPGGPDILMKVAGKDGTALFLKYHAWVNIDALMERCLIGLLEEPAASKPSIPEDSAVDTVAATSSRGSQETSVSQAQNVDGMETDDELQRQHGPALSVCSDVSMTDGGSPTFTRASLEERQSIS